MQVLDSVLASNNLALDLVLAAVLQTLALVVNGDGRAQLG